MLFPCPANPGLLSIVTALNFPCAVMLNGAGGFSTSFSRKNTPQEISDIRSEASMSECILALLAKLRLLPACCPSRTAGPQGVWPNSVWGHMKGSTWCQTRISLLLQAEHRAEGGTCHPPLLLFITQNQDWLHLSFPKQTLGMVEFLQPNQCDMKVMDEIPDFAPGFWCQTSLPDNKVQPLMLQSL